MQLLAKEKEGVMPLRIDPNSIQVQISPPFSHQIVLQSDQITVNIIPGEILTPSVEYCIDISVLPQEKNISNESVRHLLRFRTLPITSSPIILDSTINKEISSSKSQGYKIIHMAFPQPRILPSLNQIGFASLTIPFVILDSEKNSGKFIAWAVQKFGGEGSPLTRYTYYAYAGHSSGNTFMMEAHQCFFEITAFNLPLDQFRIAGQLLPDLTIAPNSSLILSKHIGHNLLAILGEMGNSSPINSKILRQYLHDVGWWEFWRAAKRFVPALYRQIEMKMWRTWGLINQAENFTALGTFKLAPFTIDSESIRQMFEIRSFAYDQKTFTIRAQIEQRNGKNSWNLSTAIMIIDIDQMQPLQINYNNLNRIIDEGITRNISLEIPVKIREKISHLRAYLLADLTELSRLDFKL
jgi:hypothetical protein